MKVYVVIFLVALAGVTSQETNDDQSKIKKYREDCIVETNVDPELIDKADSGDFTDDSKLMCFSKCFYQKAGFVAENGDLLLDVIKEKIPKDLNRDKALAIIDKCKELKGENACETVYLIHKCYFQDSRRQGEES